MFRATDYIESRWRSFGHAIRGLRLLVCSEPNARLHAIATALVVLAGGAIRLSLAEWRWVIVACVLVWSAEAFNTAIERLCDRVSTDHDPLIGAAKDIAAGSVLIAAAGALILGATIILPRLAQAWR